MNKLIKSLLIVALCTTMVSSAWSQSSTEGREFWVGLFVSSSPDGFNEKCFDPFIAISSKQQCKITISNPSQGWTLPTFTVQPDSWRVIKKDEIPLQYWYDTNWTASNASEKVTNHGIKIEATADVSVYAAARMEFSYDATNVLPVTAIQSDYIIQDYPAYNHQENKEAHAVFCIVATEDNTEVEIIPTTPTIKGVPVGQKITVNLNKGQTYQVVSTDRQTFSGTTVRAYAKGDKTTPHKIAVFSGADFTDVPGNKSARDCLYEQAMPIDYWGTEFVVTRSLEKDANRIRITAADNPADVMIDGKKVQTIQPYQTWEFEMSEDLASGDMYKEIVEKAKREVPMIFNGDAHYIKTSCPCAIFSYDVSSGYHHNNSTNVRDEALGDPSMVWISPLQQRISKITFGACGTQNCDEDGHTRRHFVNVVCLTSDVASFHLSSDQRKNINVTFTPVPGNPQYSYARQFLVDTDVETDKVYTMTNRMGFIAHVYGNGKNESYAYSVGSAAVKQGINVNGEIFSDGYISDSKFCINEEVSFDANVGNDDIESVDWNFGDGTKSYGGDAQTTHTYTTPGWYDVTANLYGHQVCTDESKQFLGSVSFTFRFVRQDTIVVNPMHKCLPVDTLLDNPSERARLLSEGDISYDPVENCYDTVHMHMVVWGEEREETLDPIVANDSVFAFNHWWFQDESYEDFIKNETGCETHRKCNIKVITCLRMDVETDPAKLHSCAGEHFALPYTKHKGNVSGARLIILPASCPDPELVARRYLKSDDGEQEPPAPQTEDDVCEPLLDQSIDSIDWSKNYEIDGVGTRFLPTENFKPGLYKVVLIVTDANCGDAQGQLNTLTFVRTIAVDYPKDIIVHKLFNNVLAVLNAANNGGYQFVAFQWYRNGEPIPGATSAVYHSDEPLNNGDQYHVEVTDINGTTLPSCDKQISGMPDEPQIDDEPAAAPAQKLLKGNQMVIRMDGHIFNIFGQRIQ